MVRGTQWYKYTTVGHRKVASLQTVASHERGLKKGDHCSHFGNNCICMRTGENKMVKHALRITVCP
jgi:hypothetical protein